jgi:toxin YoeB
MISVQFTSIAHSQFQEWEKNDKKISNRIQSLIENNLENPYKGIGKPEPLKYELAGLWNRRINKEHRLVYKVTSNSIIIISCKYHY